MTIHRHAGIGVQPQEFDAPRSLLEQPHRCLPWRYAICLHRAPISRPLTQLLRWSLSRRHQWAITIDDATQLVNQQL